MNNLTHTGIPTAGIFGMENAFGFNPVKGCNNKGCHLHPVNTGECWAAKICNRMAGPWAGSEAKFIFPFQHESLHLRTLHSYQGCALRDEIQIKMKEFKPVWFESHFQKEFPKERSCILVCYMTDIAFIPREYVQKIIDKIKVNNSEREKAGLPLHIFQFLTKDPTVYAHFEWPDNCWLGGTATNQTEFDERIDALIDMKLHRDRVIYYYLEPLREKIKLDYFAFLDWVIVGGGSTPLHPEWVRSIRDQCQEAGISFYFKGWSKKHIPMGHPFWKPTQLIFAPNPRKYKKIPGLGINWLDGKKWEQFPEVKNE